MIVVYQPLPRMGFIFQQPTRYAHSSLQFVYILLSSNRLLTTKNKLVSQGFLKNRPILAFRVFLGGYQHNMLKCVLSLSHRWSKIVLSTRFWFKVDNCFSPMFCNRLVHYLIFEFVWGHRLSLIELILYIWQFLCHEDKICDVYKFKIRAFFLTSLPTQLHVRASILLTCGNHLHDHISLLRGEAWWYITNLGG